MRRPTLGCTAGFAVIIAFISSTGPAPAAEGSSRFAKPVTLPPFEAEELISVALDSDVYEITTAGYGDLRVLDGDGAEVPYVIRRAVVNERRTERRSFQVANPAIRLQDDGSLEIVFSLDDKLPARPLGFRLVTPLKNFERRIAAEVSADDEAWIPLVDDGLIFDYSQFIDVRNIELTLPQVSQASTSGRRYRLTIAEATQEQQSQLVELTRNLNADEETSRSERLVVNRQPFRIDRIEGWYDIEATGTIRDRLRQYAVSRFVSKQDNESTATILTFRLRREPVTTIAVQTDDRNFRRRAHLQTVDTAASRRGDASDARQLGSSALERLNFRALNRENLSIAIPETRDSEYRLLIENGDSKPLTITGVAATGPIDEVVFLAQSGGLYSLQYGGDVPAPDYDTAALSESLVAGYDALPAQLGAPVPVAAPPPPSKPALAHALNDPRLLGGMIVLLVIVLGVGLYHATRRLDNLPGDKDSSA